MHRNRPILECAGSDKQWRWAGFYYPRHLQSMKSIKHAMGTSLLFDINPADQVENPGLFYLRHLPDPGLDQFHTFRVDQFTA